LCWAGEKTSLELLVTNGGTVHKTHRRGKKEMQAPHKKLTNKKTKFPLGVVVGSVVGGEAALLAKRNKSGKKRGKGGVRGRL